MVVCCYQLPTSFFKFLLQITCKIYGQTLPEYNTNLVQSDKIASNFSVTLYSGKHCFIEF